jgi:hypothetical protein
LGVVQGWQEMNAPAILFLLWELGLDPGQAKRQPNNITGLGDVIKHKIDRTTNNITT